MIRIMIAIMMLLSPWAQGAVIVIAGPSGGDFSELASLLTEELKKDYSIARAEVSKQSTYEDFVKWIDKETAVVITMDNLSLKHMKAYFEKNPDSKIRSIAAMASGLKDEIKVDSHIAGVSYEIAGYLAIMGFKKSFMKHIKKIVGIYRSGRTKLYAFEAKSQLAREKVELDLIDIDGVDESKLIEFLDLEIKKRTEIDGIWLVNDNRIINTNMVSNFWIGLARKQRLPLICGITKLSKELGVCVYSEAPTLAGIKQRVIDIALGYLIEGNSPDFYGVEYVQETDQVINKALREKLGLELGRSDAKEYVEAIVGE